AVPRGGTPHGHRFRDPSPAALRHPRARPGRQTGGVISIAALLTEPDIQLMAPATFDTHELVKELKASGFSDDQAEAVTRAVQKDREFDFSDLATKADLRTEVANLRVEMANLKSDIIKWVIGIAFAQAAMLFALLRLFPGAHT